MRSRKEDASVKERELALQSLDLAYHKYKEIIRNLDEGLKASRFLSTRYVGRLYLTVGVFVPVLQRTCGHSLPIQRELQGVGEPSPERDQVCACVLLVLDWARSCADVRLAEPEFSITQENYWPCITVRNCGGSSRFDFTVPSSFWI